MDSIIFLVNKLKLEVEKTCDIEGCIICYTYPGCNEWEKTNCLFTNFCNECDVILCKECCKKIEGYKCPICHKKSEMFSRSILESGVQILTRSNTPSCNCAECTVQRERLQEVQVQRESRELSNGGIGIVQRERILLYEIEIQRREKRRLRNQRYRQRKRERLQEVQRDV